MISKQEFEEYLKGIDTTEYEADLKKEQTKGKIAFYICLGLGFAIAAAVVSYVMAKKVYELFYMLIFCVPFFMLGFFLKRRFDNKILQEFDDKYRNQFIAKLLEGYEYTYDRNSYISPEIYQKSHFTTLGDEYTGQDLLTITIPNKDGEKTSTKLSLCDLHIVEHETYRDNDGTTRTETITLYAGVFAYVELQEPFKCSMAINTTLYDKNSRLVQLEDINFNKRLKTYSNDQLEVRYILTPDMMQKLLNLSKRSSMLKLKFVGKEAFMGLKFDLFEAKKMQPGMTLSETYLSLYDDIAFVLKLVNELSKNNKVFKI